MNHQLRIWILGLLIAASAAWPTQAKAQCNPWLGDQDACPGDTMTMGFSGFNPGSGHYRYQISVQAGALTYISNPTPSQVRFRVNYGNPAFVWCSRYDSVYNCTSNIEQDLWVEHLPNETMLTTIPVCPDTSLTYLNVLMYQNYTFGSPMISVQVNGGTLLNRITNLAASNYLDSLWIKWADGVPHSITAMYRGVGYWANGCPMSKTYYPPGSSDGIYGAQDGCADGMVRHYSVAADTGFTFYWTATNGSIVGGQGTEQCDVLWQGSGELVLQRNYAWCNSISLDTLFYTEHHNQINLGADTSICVDTSVVLTVGDPSFHQIYWSTGSTQNSITVSNPDTYTVSAYDAFGCTLRDTIVITGLSDCVFPGDANYDGVADNQDILAIGAYYGNTNLPRANASLNWFGQSTPDWGTPLPGAADPKHSDCDGNGLVQASDTLAVTLNYLRTHNKTTDVATTGARLHAVPVSDTVLMGDVAWFALMLDDDGQNVDSIYGLAASISVSSQSPASMEAVDFSNCWFAAPGNQLSFSWANGTQTEREIAVVRTDQNDAIGQGEVCRIGVQTDPNQTQAYTDLSLAISNLHLVSHGLTVVPVVPNDGHVVIADQLSASHAPQVLPQPQLFPTPARDAVQVVMPRGDMQALRLYDLQGRLLREAPLQGARTATISVAELETGMYILQVRTRSGQSSAKLMVQH